MKTIREETVGAATIRLVRVNAGESRGVLIVDGRTETFAGDNDDEIWERLKKGAAASNPNFFGFEGAKNRFLEIFPLGFSDAAYIDSERRYKDDAKAYLDKHAPLAAAKAGDGFAQAALAAFRMTNLLHPTFERSRIADMLQGPLADPFVRGAARFADGDVRQGLLDMTQALKKHDVAKWTAVTYLPFLWRPEAHMFLKPEVTCDFAERVGHRFAREYESALVPSVYDSLLDLARTTEHEIAELGPKDSIDVQSFIWVVGKYDANDKAQIAATRAGVPNS